VPAAGPGDEVAPGFERLPLRTPTLPPATHTNAYLFGTGEAVLIEPASQYPEEIRRAADWVEAARSRGQRLVAILVTHHHGDHVGGARALADVLDLPLWAHPGTADRLQGELVFDRLLEDGEELSLAAGAEERRGPRRLRCVHTPGHAPGHLCFFDPESRAMVAGDMVAGVGTILVEPTDGHMGRYLASLRRMRRLSPSVLLPAHGDPIRDPDRCLDHYLRHRLAREAKVLAALVDHGEPASPDALVPVAYQDAPAAVWGLAASSTEAHLLELARQGRARRRSDGRWEPADPRDDPEDATAAVPGSVNGGPPVPGGR